MTDHRDSGGHVGPAPNVPTQSAAPTPGQPSVPVSPTPLSPQPPRPKPVLTKEERRKRNRRNFRLLLFVLTLSIGLILGFFLGRSWPDRKEVSFYANILEVNDSTLLVEGIPENDVNHRSQAYLSLDDLDTAGMAQTSTDENVPIADLEVGDLIRVTYDGTTLESFPLQIPHVWRIERTEP